MFRFEELEIWKLAMNYARECYKIANEFPQEEKYALADQLKRSAVSISNNIAEGSIESGKRFKNFLTIAIGSTLETVNILYFAVSAGYLVELRRVELYQDAEKLIRKTRNFIKSLDL